MKALALAPNGATTPMLSNVFEEWFGNDFFTGVNSMMPKTNIIEKDDHYLIELSVAGYRKNDFEINVDRKLLTISNSKETSGESDKDNFVVREFSRKSFTKSFNLSNTIDTVNISAKCEDGILSITLPKIEEAKSKPPRQIKIK